MIDYGVVVESERRVISTPEAPRVALSQERFVTIRYVIPGADEDRNALHEQILALLKAAPIR